MTDYVLFGRTRPRTLAASAASTCPSVCRCQPDEESETVGDDDDRRDDGGMTRDGEDGVAWRESDYCTPEKSRTDYRFDARGLVEVQIRDARFGFGDHGRARGRRTIVWDVPRAAIMLRCARVTG